MFTSTNWLVKEGLRLLSEKFTFRKEPLIILTDADPPSLTSEPKIGSTVSIRIPERFKRREDV